MGIPDLLATRYNSSSVMKIEYCGNKGRVAGKPRNELSTSNAKAVFELSADKLADAHRVCRIPKG